MDMAPYVGIKVDGVGKIIKLSSNEGRLAPRRPPHTRNSAPFTGIRMAAQ